MFHRSAARRRLTGLGVAVTVAAVAAVVGASPAHAATPVTIDLKWSKNFGVAGSAVAKGSPMVATLDGGGPSVLVGDRKGSERAYHLRDGSNVAGWPTNTGGVAVDATPSVLGSGASALTFWGEGSSSAPSRGGYRAVRANGSQAWSVKPICQPGKAPTCGVMSSLAIGNLSAANDVVGGSMGQMQYELKSANGQVEHGFPWFQADSNFTTPAVSDIHGQGRDAIIEGGDSTAGNAFGTQYRNGGHIRVLNALGTSGQPTLSGGVRCQYDTNQVVQSSPAVGNFLNGAAGIAAGTGTYWKGASDTNKLIVLDRACHLRFKADLGGATDTNPALADTTGTGALSLIMASRGSSTSRVYTLDPNTGKARWWVTVPGQVFGGPAAADVNGDGKRDVVVATTSGAFVLDGATGATLAKFGAGFGFQNTPLITQDPDGSIGLTLAGYDGHNAGVLLHYSIRGSNGANVDTKGSWPMFHHDPQLTGDAASPIKQ